jgi:hypothetical protein
MHQPSWYKENKILIINTSTCGINKDGHEQYIVDPKTGTRSDDKIDDALAIACEQVQTSNFTGAHVTFQPADTVTALGIFVPKYYDMSTNLEITKLINSDSRFEPKTLAELSQMGLIEVSGGHGSPSSDQRLGEVPYIKVSDLRAGSVNINPTNMIPIALAKQFWRSDSSGLKAYDLISPERASKNIGEFCVLMPGQQNLVLTKEVIIIRAKEGAPFSQFFLMWALSLSAVRKQWDRVIFMQTNREDVGKRMLEIVLPFTRDTKFAESLALPFKTYYENLEAARRKFIGTIETSQFPHHIHLGGAD